MSSNIVAITLENFQQVILEESKSKLVLVSFWAEQVPESVELRDTLSTKVSAFPDHMILATVDCQTQGQIAQQFGIQGLPTAVLVKDGQPADALSGPQTEELVQAFLDKHLPKPEDTLLAEAKAALRSVRKVDLTLEPLIKILESFLRTLVRSKVNEQKTKSNRVTKPGFTALLSTSSVETKDANKQTRVAAKKTRSGTF